MFWLAIYWEDWGSAELQDVDSYSISEATKYVSTLGDERYSDDEEELIDSCYVFENFDDEGYIYIYNFSFTKI